MSLKDVRGQFFLLFCLFSSHLPLFILFPTLSVPALPPLCPSLSLSDPSLLPLLRLSSLCPRLPLSYPSPFSVPLPPLPLTPLSSLSLTSPLSLSPSPLSLFPLPYSSPLTAPPPLCLTPLSSLYLTSPLSLYSPLSL